MMPILLPEALATAPELKIGAPAMLFSGNYLGPGSIALDSGRFLMMRNNGQDAAGKVIYLVMNWADELKSKFPAK